MFGFHYHEMETLGSAERFPKRIEKFKKANKRFPMLQHYFWWITHNCVTHFLIGILPIKPFFKFHDWTSVKLNAGQDSLTTPFEDLKACRDHVQKTKDILESLTGNADADSIYFAQTLIDELDKDIRYHEQNGTSSTGRPLRKAFRLIFKEH
jgi:hypothetical protein